MPSHAEYAPCNVNPRTGHAPLPASAESPSRIGLVDVLRGSALVGLFLLHCVEHFEIGAASVDAPAWLKAIDGWVYASAFFLFGGKAYAVLATLFGLSFFLQLESAAQRGEAYRGRFVWRLLVLAAIGYVNGLMFCGDFLMIIAVLGLPLAVLSRASNRVIAVLAVPLLLQVPVLWTVGRIFFEGYVPEQPEHWALYGKLGKVFTEGSFLDVLAMNSGRGQTARFLFTYETGRYLQMSGLFLCGLLLGRARLFEDATRAVAFAWRGLVVGIIGFSMLYPLAGRMTAAAPEGLARYVVGGVFGSYVGLAQILIWVSGFILLYHRTRAQTWLQLLAPYGRTSLTSYVTQGLFWVPFYYAFGLAMHRHLGSTLSLLSGIPFLVLQCYASTVWLRHFRYGPLEWLWRSLTRLSFATPLRLPKRGGSQVNTTISAHISANDDYSASAPVTSRSE